MEKEELVRLAAQAIEEKKGEDLAVFSVAAKLGYTDTIMLVTGNNHRHVDAIVEEVRGRLVSAKQEILGVEGREQGEWVLLDAGDLIVHVMQPAAREYYLLDRAWADCKIELK